MPSFGIRHGKFAAILLWWRCKQRKNILFICYKKQWETELLETLFITSHDTFYVLEPGSCYHPGAPCRPQRKAGAQSLTVCSEQYSHGPEEEDGDEGCSERLRPEGRRSLHIHSSTCGFQQSPPVSNSFKKRALIPSPTCAPCHHLQQTTTFMANFPSYTTKPLLL